MTRAVPAANPTRSRVRTARAPAPDTNGKVAAASSVKDPKPPSKRSRRKAASLGQPARRVVRRVDTWTVFKLSLLFYICVFAVLMVAGIILWNVAASFGVLTHIEKFVRSLFDLNKFQFRVSRRPRGCSCGRRHTSSSWGRSSTCSPPWSTTSTSDMVGGSRSS